MPQQQEVPQQQEATQQQVSASDFGRARDDFAVAIGDDGHQFAATLAFIDQWFDYRPTAFRNGPVRNSSDQNQGSCKVFGLARLLDLDREQTLRCFGEHYRDVLAIPQADNHHNLRRVLADGLGAIEFDSFPLAPRRG